MEASGGEVIGVDVTCKWCGGGKEMGCLFDRFDLRVKC